jgi:hypothetical protein
MAFTFSQEDIQRISKTLGATAKHKGNNVRLEIEEKESKRRLALEIYPDIQIGRRRGSLVSVYTRTSHLQLHFCTAYVLSDMLGEVTFVGESDGKLSGLIVEREGGCSLYANVDREILSGDFTTLGPEVMLSGIALSLTETMLPTPELADKVAPKKTGRSSKRPQATKKARTRKKPKPS